MTILAGVKKIDKSVFKNSRPAIIAPHIPVGSFDAEDKPDACRGFAKLYLDGAEIDGKIKAGYLKYIKGQKKRLYPKAIQHEALLRLMFAEKMIVRKDIDPLLEECDRQNNIAAKAAVLDYAGRSLEPVDPFAEMEKEFAKMERQAKRFEKTGQLPASELKKIWSTKKLEDGTLEITSYKGTDTTVSVPAVIGKTAVTAIGKKALSPLASRLTPEQKRVRETLESVTIPKGVTEIGGSAFYGCANLTSVTIPEGVTEIGYSAFWGCANLTSVTIPESVKVIRWEAFKGCTSLTSVTIPEGVTEIGYSVFWGCKKLTSVTIPEGVTEIGDSAFRGCANLTSVTIPEGVTEIGRHAFYGCKKLTIHAPAGSAAEQYAKKYKIPFEAI